MSRVLIIDAANVVGSKPDGWWKDRAGAARRLHEAVLVADLPYDDVVLVLEGAAKAGVPVGRDAHVRVVHASGEGDAEIVRQGREAAQAGHQVTTITADRMLSARAGSTGDVLSPTWLRERL